MNKPTTIYTLTLELMLHIKTKGSLNNNYHEELDDNGYYRAESQQTFKVYQDVYITEVGIKKYLTTGARKLLDQIGDELYMNNALWYYNTPKHKYDIVNELIEKGILIKTENPHIFFVNPLRIRRGSPASVLALTMQMLKNVSKPTKDHLKELRYTKAIKIDKIDSIDNTSLIDIKLIEMPKVKKEEGGYQY